MQTFVIIMIISKHTTIIDIAEKLGISPSTVSRALNDHPHIKSETKEKVKKLAKRLHYYPNPIAQSLKSNQTTTIGVIVPEIKHVFFFFCNKWNRGSCVSIWLYDYSLPIK